MYASLPAPERPLLSLRGYEINKDNEISSTRPFGRRRYQRLSIGRPPSAPARAGPAGVATASPAPADPVGRDVPLEIVLMSVPVQAGRAAAEQPQQVVGDGIAEAVAEDVVDRPLDVLPQRQGGHQVRRLISADWSSSA